MMAPHLAPAARMAGGWTAHTSSCPQDPGKPDGRGCVPLPSLVGLGLGSRLSRTILPGLAQQADQPSCKRSRRQPRNWADAGEAASFGTYSANASVRLQVRLDGRIARGVEHPPRACEHGSVAERTQRFTALANSELAACGLAVPRGG